jgi:tetratricopeptide (TPR) repeat protein
MAQLLRAEGKPEQAAPLYEQVVALAREIGDQESIAIGLLNLAMVAIERGSDVHATRLLLEVLDINEQGHSKPVSQSALDVCAGLATLRSDWQQAACFFGASEAFAEQTGLRRVPADARFLEPRIRQARQAAGSSDFAAHEAAGRALSANAAIEAARNWLARRG